MTRKTSIHTPSQEAAFSLLDIFDPALAEQAATGPLGVLRETAAQKAEAGGWALWAGLCLHSSLPLMPVTADADSARRLWFSTPVSIQHSVLRPCFRARFGRTNKAEVGSPA